MKIPTSLRFVILSYLSIIGVVAIDTYIKPLTSEQFWVIEWGLFLVAAVFIWRLFTYGK